MKQKVLILIVILSCILINGCWDRIEPEKQAIVIGGGFDYNPERDMYKTIFQIASPLTMKGAGAQGGGTEKPNYWTVSAWGHTPYDAIANLNKKVSRKITFSQAQLYVFSEKMARGKGVLPILNAVARSRQSRRVLIIAVVNGDVEKMLTVNFPIESSNVMALTNQIDLTMKSMGGITSENVKDFFVKLVQPGYEPFAVALEFVENRNEEKEAEEKESGPDTEPPVRIIGKYIFKNDKVVGLFKDRETRGCNWIFGKVRSGTLVLSYPEDETVKVDVLASEDWSKITPIFIDGKPSIKIDIKATGRIVNITGLSDIKEESDISKSLNKRMAQVIENDIDLALKKAQSHKTDVFGFGFAFYRLMPEEWANMEDDWDNIFSSISVEVNVRANIKNIGLVNRGPDIK